jgi:CRP/FNR family transcriptional regulator, transcriptional activator FtrB
MPQKNFDEIRELDLFSKLKDESFSKLMRGAYFKQFPPQIELIDEGDSADFLHILTSGAVELFSRWENRETTLATVFPISTFILAATMTDLAYLMSARTLEKSQIILIPSEDVRAVFSEDRDFANAIVLELARCYRGVVRTTKNLKLRSASERLANHLLVLHKRMDRRNSLTLPYEKRRLASYLGMTAENLSRTFTLLAENGVEVHGKEVVISDLGKLEAFARPTSLIDG